MIESMPIYSSNNLSLFSMLYKFQNPLYINKRMGKQHSQSEQPQHSNASSQQLQQASQQTPSQVWRHSEKSSDDVVKFMDSSSTLDQSCTELFKYISSIRNPHQYQVLINSIITFIQSEKSEERDPYEERQHLYKFLKAKYNCSLLLGDKEVTEKNLLQIERKSNSEKLFYLYDQHQEKSIIKAIKCQYPEILLSFPQFVQLLLENLIYIDQDFQFSIFILNKQDHLEAIDEAERRAKFLSQTQRNQLFTKMKQTHNLVPFYIQGVNVFLKNDYPHGAILIFQTLIQKQYKLQKSEKNLYLYARIHELLLNEFNHFQITFNQQIKDWPMPKIIDFLLKGNQDFECLKSLQAIHRDIGLEDEFEQALNEYAFSKQCLLSQSIGLILDGFLNSNEISIKFLEKVLESKFQLLANPESQELLMKTFTKIDTKKQVLQKVRIAIDIAQLMTTFKINEKIKSIWVFISHQREYTSIQLQEKALFFIKSFNSQFFIQKRSKSIKIGFKESVDLSKPESILAIEHYLHETLFKKYINLADIHQITFQHMLFYEKYKEVQTFINSTQLLAKYTIHKEMIELLIIQNMMKQMCRNQMSQISNDISTQLNMLKNQENFQIQVCKATFNLLKLLQNNYIFLPEEVKEKIQIKLLYYLLEAYPQKINSINFDEIYEYIRIINSNQMPEDQYVMTNELLLFKGVLAEKAYQQNHEKLGKEIIEQMKRFEPPWLTTQIIKILQNNSSIVKDQIFGIALESCVKGEDLEYLMKLWKQREKKKKASKIKVTQLFDTQRKYLVLNDELIKDEDQYRNVVAEIKFGQKTLQQKKYDLFFIFLGTQPERAFYHIIQAQLQTEKIYRFLMQGVKRYVIQGFILSKYLYKCLYFLKSGQIPNFKEYASKLFTFQEVESQKPERDTLFEKVHGAYLCTFFINAKFINTYLNDSTSHPIYGLLYDKTARNNILVGLREQPMGTQDIKIIYQLGNCFGIDFCQLCIFSLSSIANSSIHLTENCEHILSKIIVFLFDKQECRRILKRLIEKIHSVKMLIEVLEYIKLHFQEIITQRHIQVLKSLALVQVGYQFHGLIPLTYFDYEINYRPQWPIQQQHQTIINKSGKKTNIFVLSKTVYFFYGMNPKVEKKILDEFLERNESDEELMELKQQLIRK